VFCRRGFSLSRFLLALFGLRWLAGDCEPSDPQEAQAWKERRRRFRAKLREAFRELLAEDGQQV
jgi:hypothetical protein